jgi:ABC-type spermidine/putrescine transport system permease subunit I
MSILVAILAFILCVSAAYGVACLMARDIEE